ncbi:MAG: helix-turn-helix domain-containing protein [Nannocystaceae bacterium]
MRPRQGATTAALRADDRRGEGGPVFVTRHASTEARSGHPPVTHAHAALAFLTAGRAHVEQEGRWTVEAGDVFLVPAGARHRALAVDPHTSWGLGICTSCLAADGAAELLEPFERVRAGGSAVVRIPTERRAFLEALFRELDQADVPASVQRSLVTLILHEVTRAARWPEATASGTGVVVESLRVIERRCLGPLTLVDVAAAVGRTPSHVTTALTRATGRSALAWILAGRMAEARRLLLHSDEPVEAIAGRVGYGDTTHFIRMFRREHGATPAAWRARARRG